MKRYLLAGEIAIIGILFVLILLDFTGIGRKTRKQYNAIDHIPPKTTPGVVSVPPLSDDQMIYHKEGDELIPPTPTPTNTPTPTPTLTPEEKKVKDIMDKAYSCSIPGNIAFAQVEDYLSIRREPDGNSTRLGLMDPGDSCLVESVNGDWCYVQSGGVKGYCLTRCLLRGTDAEEYAKQHVIYHATILENVNLRTEPTTQAENVIKTLETGTVVIAKTPALKSDNDPTTPVFTEVELPDGTRGYIATNLCEITYTWPVGRAIDDRKEQ